MSRNIKNKENRKSVERALRKILHATNDGFAGMAFFSDGDEILIEKYDGAERNYYCGREYQMYIPAAYEPYLLIVIDTKEAAVGTTDGERIRVLWTDTSLVWSKHGQGGQSQARFHRVREETIKQWLRKVVEIASGHFTGQDIIIGGAGMTKDRFVEELPRNMQERILRVDSVGYTDENGLWELMKISRHEKV